MYENKRVVVVIPAGRREYLSILLPLLHKERPLVDEVQLWFNTVSVEDDTYLHKQQSDFVKLIEHPKNNPTGNGYGIHPFYLKTTDSSTVYVRFDDDIVWLEPGGLARLIEFRLANPQYFLVSANLINNALCSYIHQSIGAIPPSPKLGYRCMDELGWRSGDVAAMVHRTFLDNPDPARYRYEPWVMDDYCRFSINLISWLGSDMARTRGIVGPDEEVEMSVTLPKRFDMPCVFFGGCVAAHYSFHVQKPYLDRNTNILQRYRKLSEVV